MMENKNIEQIGVKELASHAERYLYNSYRRSIAQDYFTLHLESYFGSVEELVDAILKAKVQRFTFRGNGINDCAFISLLLASGFGAASTVFPAGKYEASEQRGLNFYVI